MAEAGIDIDKLKENIEELIVKTLIAVQPDLLHNYRISKPSKQDESLCFEILG